MAGNFLDKNSSAPVNEQVENMEEGFKRISPAEARKVLVARQTGGDHVDSRILRELDALGELHLITLKTSDEFLSLIWQSSSECRPLAPVGETRILHDCALRLEQYDWSFHNVCESGSGYPWFEKCVQIDESFDLSRFHWIALTPCVNNELRESPRGTYYIYDGVHKAIVLAKKLIRNELAYTPITALLLTPRRK